LTDALDRPLPNENVLGGWSAKQRKKLGKPDEATVRSFSLTVDGGVPVGLETLVKLNKLKKASGGPKGPGMLN
jgi:hypothetical protein